MSECKYVNEKGICEIANIPCDDVLLCSEDAVYTDSKKIEKNKEDKCID